MTSTNYVCYACHAVTNFWYIQQNIIQICTVLLYKSVLYDFCQLCLFHFLCGKRLPKDGISSSFSLFIIRIYMYYTINGLLSFHLLYNDELLVHIVNVNMNNIFSKKQGNKYHSKPLWIRYPSFFPFYQSWNFQQMLSDLCKLKNINIWPSFSFDVLFVKVAQKQVKCNQLDTEWQ